MIKSRTEFLGVSFIMKKGHKVFVKAHPSVRKEIENYLNKDYGESDRDLNKN